MAHALTILGCGGEREQSASRAQPAPQARPPPRALPAARPADFALDVLNIRPRLDAVRTIVDAITTRAVL